MDFAFIAVLLALAGIVCCFIPKARIAGKILLCLALFIGVCALWLLSIVLILLGSAHTWLIIPVTLGVLALVALFIFIIWYRQKRRIVFLLLAVEIICVILVAVPLGIDIYKENIPVVDDGGDILYQYNPTYEYNKIVTLPEPSTLTITSDLPSLDGATALYPVYAAFAKAIYPSRALANDKLLACTTTTTAYERLIAGDVDMIFVAAASAAQMQAAADAGVELIFTPIGREAFVFFVNSKNPVEDITIEQIRGIYSGEITEWRQLGVSGLGKIRAFQRDEGSGSQTALQKLMEGRTLMEPTEKDRINGMGGIIIRTADYRNYKNAIGYSFRFYSTEMVKNNQIKLLKIGGVAPTRENIINGSYPICSTFYAVTTAKSNPKCADIIEWILSEQGQYIIEETGYVGIGN